jgi:hypothetical protein
MKLLGLLPGSTDTSTKSPAQVVQRLRELIDDFGVTDIVNVTQFRNARQNYLYSSADIGRPYARCTNSKSSNCRAGAKRGPRRLRNRAR